MYIFELITGLFKHKKKGTPDIDYIVKEEELVENSDECEHLFMPLDSSNEYFACKNCGLVVPADKINQH